MRIRFSVNCPIKFSEDGVEINNFNDSMRTDGVRRDNFGTYDSVIGYFDFGIVSINDRIRIDYGVIE